MKSVARLLRESVALLKEKGWTKGAFHNEDNDTYCAVGALDQVFANTYGEMWGNDPAVTNQYYLARSALDEVALKDGYVDAIVLNDAEETTFEKVRSMFTAAIQAAKQV